ncbi:MAG: UPF0149 family protein [Holosporaceae bacterium]|jgi:uncharacterized protein|nr:UPF0149 family protein [Holosporaceae bacterium]
MPASKGNELSKPLGDEEIAKLSDILDSFPNENSMTLEMLDGFFTALYCCPRLVPPSRYMHSIYGNESEDEAPFEDEKQFYIFFELLMRYWNGVGNRLQSGKFKPFLEDIPEAGTGWSVGFLQGVLLAEGDFVSMMRDEDESMAFMSFFMLAFGNDKLHEDLPPLLKEEVTPEMRKDLLEGLSVSAMFLYSRFNDSGRVDVPRPACGDKIGRNDPCPCGSGKKYKKCCLNRAVH